MVSLIEMPEPLVTTQTNERGAPRRRPDASRIIEIEHLDFAYGANHVLHDVSLSIPAARSPPSSVHRVAARRRCSAASTG